MAKKTGCLFFRIPKLRLSRNKMTRKPKIAIVKPKFKNKILNQDFKKPNSKTKENMLEKMSDFHRIVAYNCTVR